MSIVKWEPGRAGLWNRFPDVEQFFDYFNPFFSPEGIERSKNYWHPAVDVFESEEHVMVKVDLPGLEEKDIHVGFDGHILTIEGERKEDHEGNGFFNRERFSGKFHRVLHLPSMINNEGLKARYHHGVLKIEIPKKEEAKFKTVAVEMEE